MSYSAQFSYPYPSSHLLTAAAVAATSCSGGAASGTCTGLDTCSCQQPVSTQGQSINHQSQSPTNQIQPLYASDTSSTPSSTTTSRILSSYTSRLTSTTPTGLPMYTSSYHDQGYVSLATTDPSAFYSPLANTYDLAKDGMSAAGGAWGNPAAYPYDPAAAAAAAAGVAPMSQYAYSNGYGPVDINGSARRKNATRETTNTLKAWLYEHRKNPYPTKGEKIMLAIITKMTLTQVSTWFANARRRLKKENKMTWSPRNRCGDADDDDDDEKDDLIDNSNDDKIVCKKEMQDHKDSTGQLRDDYESEPEIGTECRSMTSSGSLSNTPKPTIDVVGGGNPISQAGNSQVRYHHHHHHPIHPLQDSQDSNINNPLKPKIWSLAQTATSCAPSPIVSHYCRGPTLSPPQPHLDHQFDMRYTYASAFSISKIDRRTPPSPQDSSLLYRGYQTYQTPSVENDDSNAEKAGVIPPPPVDPWLGPTHGLPAAPTGPIINNATSITASTHHIISSQADTPPQTPPSAQQQQGSLNNNNNDDDNGSSVTSGLNAIDSYVATNNNVAPTYTPSFHGLKSIYEQSSFLGISNGFKTEPETKPDTLTI